MTREEAMEHQANLFAMHLLIPEDWLRADLKKLGGIDIEDDSKVEGLAKKYGVSRQIMTLRIAQMMETGK